MFTAASWVAGYGRVRTPRGIFFMRSLRLAGPSRTIARDKHRSHPFPESVPRCFRVQAKDSVMYHWDYMHGSWWGGIVIGLWMLFFVLLIAVLAWMLIRHPSFRTRGKPPEETPLEIIKKRYARGEITKDEFDRIRRDLGG